MTYRIKPLEWEDRHGWQIASTVFGAILVTEQAIHFEQQARRSEVAMDDKKRLAEAWYKERLLAALDLVEPKA
jgi:hypothetical protein